MGDEVDGVQVPLRQQPVSAQQALVMAVITALLGAAGGAGGGITFGSSAEIAELRAEVATVNRKLDEIMRVIDEKHPRQ